MRDHYHSLAGLLQIRQQSFVEVAAKMWILPGRGGLVDWTERPPGANIRVHSV